MPIGKFFSITSVFVAVLAVILIGKGTGALQEAGLVGANPIGIPRVDLLGIYPTAQTVMAQMLVLTIALTGFGINLALLNKSGAGRADAFSSQSYNTGTVIGVPSRVKRFRTAARTCNSAT